MSDTPKVEPALTSDEWATFTRTSGVKRNVGDGGRPVGVAVGWPWTGINISAEHSAAGLPPSMTHAVAALALYGQPFGVTREMLAGLEALAEMGCTCGVVTLADSARWEVAMREVPRLIAALRALLPPDEPMAHPLARE